MAIDREKVLQAAQKLVEKRKYDKAALEYQKLIAEDPNDARILLKIGDLQSKAESYPDAIATYERVGKFYASQGFALKAIAVYKQIREIIAKHTPQLEDRYGHITPKLAELYQQLGLTSDALAALDEVATKLQRQNRDPEAVDVFRRVVELDPTNPLPHLRLAEALSRVQDVDGAVAEFGLAASQLVRLGRRDDALKVLERLLQHRPDAAHARIAAELYLARAGANDGMQALAKLQLCFQANPKDLDTLALLARAFAAIGQAAKGVEVQKEMAKLAKEQGKRELWKQIVETLSRVAPHDATVKQLMATARAELLEPPPSGRRGNPPPLSRPPPKSAEIEELSADQLMDLSDETPGSLPTSLPGKSDLPLAGVPLEIAEEYLQPGFARDDQGLTDPNEQLAQVLADAASFRRVRLYGKAIETLRIGLELEPRSLDLREFLRDVLLEAQQIEPAIEEMLVLASLYADSLEGEAAARSLQDVLAYDRGNERARGMLHELGYEVMDDEEHASSEAVLDYASSAPPRAASGSAGGGQEGGHPLPSYDLEEIGPGDISEAYSDPSLRAAAAVALRKAGVSMGGMGDIDDPFGDDGDGEPAPADLRVPAPIPAKGPAHAVAAAKAPAANVTPEGRPRRGSVPDLEAALEEADFFVSRGLFDDARAILDDLVERLPGHRLVLERLSDLEANEVAAGRGSGTRQLPRDGGKGAAPRPGGVPRPGSAPKQPPRPEPSKPAAAAKVPAVAPPRASPVALPGPSPLAGKGPSTPKAMNAAGPTNRLPTRPGEATGTPRIDVEEVFAKFKEGVAKQLGEGDGQSHYDLGVAYKEMGLVEDALREFTQAARDPKRECVCQSMIGLIESDRGRLNEAIDAFQRGLEASNRTPEQETMLLFELGARFEQRRSAGKALEYYRKVIARDPGYRDTQERIRRLSKGETKGSIRAAAVGADDEFDRAFDEMLGTGKPS